MPVYGPTEGGSQPTYLTFRSTKIRASTPGKPFPPSSGSLPAPPTPSPFTILRRSTLLLVPRKAPGLAWLVAGGSGGSQRQPERNADVAPELILSPLPCGWVFPAAAVLVLFPVPVAGLPAKAVIRMEAHLSLLCPVIRGFLVEGGTVRDCVVPGRLLTPEDTLAGWTRGASPRPRGPGQSTLPDGGRGGGGVPESRG